MAHQAAKRWCADERGGEHGGEQWMKSAFLGSRSVLALNQCLTVDTSLLHSV